MSAASIFAGSKSPDVEVVNVMDSGALSNGSLYLLVVNVGGGRLHESEDALLDGGVRGTDDDNGENEGDNGVSNLSLGPEPDDHGSDDNSNGVQKVSENVEHSTIEVDVGLFLLSFEKRLLITVSMAAMGVSMSVTMTVVVTVVAVNMVVTSEDGHLDNIEDESGNSGDEHNIFLDLGGSKESVVCSEEQPDGDAPEEGK